MTRFALLAGAPAIMSEQAEAVPCWSRRSRELLVAALLVLRRRGVVVRPCEVLLARFLLEPPPTLATWSPAVEVSAPLGRMASCRWSPHAGHLVFTAQPMAETPQGRYAELRVMRLSGQARCGIVLGVTLLRPGTWAGRPPRDVSAVPRCVWGVPRSGL
uniref:Uncharacterized protein n=1 Tax=Alexandrium monilatum TaxID=311494 RepID=A0A7S4PTB4_9DINO